LPLVHQSWVFTLSLLPFVGLGYIAQNEYFRVQAPTANCALTIDALFGVTLEIKSL
jgi:hypothetical protein